MQINHYIHSKTDLFNERFRNGVNAYKLIRMADSPVDNHRSWLDGPFHNATGNYDLDSFDWTAAAAKIASGEMSMQQATDFFMGMSQTNLQQAVDMLNAEKAKLPPLAITKRQNLRAVIDKLKSLLASVTINTNTGGGNSTSPPLLINTNYGGVPPNELGNTGGIVNTTNTNVNTNTNDGNKVGGIPTKYLVYGGIGLAAVVGITVLYFVLKPTLNK